MDDAQRAEKLQAWWEELEERWPEASKVHKQMMISWSGFHLLTSYVLHWGSFFLRYAGFHFMITPPEKAFWFHMIFYYT